MRRFSEMDSYYCFSDVFQVSFLFHAVVVLGDDDVVEDLDIEEFECFPDFPSGFQVCFCGLGVVAGVVVYEDDGGGVDQAAGSDDIFSVYRGVAGSSEADEFVPDYLVV
jgi:hypothetical protein